MRLNMETKKEFRERAELARSRYPGITRVRMFAGTAIIEKWNGKEWVQVYALYQN